MPTPTQKRQINCWQRETLRDGEMLPGTQTGAHLRRRWWTRRTRRRAPPRTRAGCSMPAASLRAPAMARSSSADAARAAWAPRPSLCTPLTACLTSKAHHECRGNGLPLCLVGEGARVQFSSRTASPEVFPPHWLQAVRLRIVFYIAFLMSRGDRLYVERRELLVEGDRPELPPALDPFVKGIITSCWHPSCSTVHLRCVHSFLRLVTLGIQREVLGDWSCADHVRIIWNRCALSSRWVSFDYFDVGCFCTVRSRQETLFLPNSGETALYLQFEMRFWVQKWS